MMMSSLYSMQPLRAYSTPPQKNVFRSPSNRSTLRISDITSVSDIWEAVQDTQPAEEKMSKFCKFIISCFKFKWCCTTYDMEDYYEMDDMQGTIRTSTFNDLL